MQEQQARRLLYRGAFSVGNPAGGLFYNPFDLSVKGIANTGVVHWAGKLLALYEARLGAAGCTYWGRQAGLQPVICDCAATKPGAGKRGHSL